MYRTIVPLSSRPDGNPMLAHTASIPSSLRKSLEGTAGAGGASEADCFFRLNNGIDDPGERLANNGQVSR
jgi:hypothetical protein